MKKLNLSLFILIVFNLLLALSASGQDGGKIKRSPNPIPNRYIVVLRETNKIFTGKTTESAAVSRLAGDLTATYGGTVDLVYQTALKGYAVKMSPEQAVRMSQDARVKYVEEDSMVFPTQMYPATTQSPAVWGLDRIDQRNLPLNNTYNYVTTGAGVHAYVIDTGIRATHTEFTGRVGNGTTFVNDGQGTNDCNGHGTHVAGTIGGTTYGVAKGATLHPVRVFGCTGGASNSIVIAAIDWVTANRVLPAVVNMSLSGSGQSSAEATAISNSMAAGVTYAVAAGNETDNSCNYSPAFIPGVVTVGATGQNDGRASFSNYGNCVDLFAPGVGITSAWFNNDTDTNSINGTSMATPHVAGVIARFLQANPTASPAVAGNSVINSATTGLVTGLLGSPNRLLYSEVILNPNPPDPPSQPAIVIPDSGLAIPYPSTFTVSGLTGNILNTPGSLQIKINGFSHTFPSDISLLLESPTGAKLLVQNDVGVNTSVGGINYTISDTGVSPHTGGPILNGAIYKPGALALPTFPSPGPGTTYNSPALVGTATLTSTFGGTNPNGVWKLYVIDEYEGDAGEITSWSLQITSGATPPSTPTNVTATPASSSQINVAWNANPVNDNVTSYNLRVNGSSVTTSITTLTRAVTGLNPNTAYTFEIQAVNASGVSGWSAPVSATTQPLSATAPTGLTATAVSSSQINTAWSANPTNQGITSYNLRVNGSSVTTGITSLSRAVTGLNPNTTYSFEVQAVNSLGVSAWSVPVSATTLILPGTPTGVTATAVSSSQIDVAWSANPINEAVTSYNLRINGSSVTTGITSITRAVTELNPITTYTFEVQAVNAFGVSGWSAPVSATTQPALATAPTGLTATPASSSQINTAWSANPTNQGITSYNLRVNGSSVTTGITSLSRAVTGLTPGTTYSFEVQAVNALGVSPWSAPVSATTSIFPGTPTGVTATAVSSSQINVAWSANPTNELVTSYNLRVNGSSVTTGITSLSRAVNGLNPITTYSFEIQAVNAFGVSGWSAPVSATTHPIPPTPPTNARATVVSSFQINVFWDAPNSTNVVSYNLRINGSQIINNIQTLSYPVTGLTPGTTYSFEVQAVNSVGVTSDWSNLVSATTTPPPNAPTNIRASAVSTSQINVFWDGSNSPNITSYNLRVNGGTPITGITYLSWAVRNLIPNTTYTFEVQAVNSSGVPSAWSTPVNATTLPIVPAGNVRGSAVSTSQINIFWDPSPTSGIASYQLRVNGGTPITGITYLSWAVTGLTPNTAYTFEVRAVDGAGNVSAWTNPISVTTNPIAPPPNAPTNIRASAVSTSQINVFWDGSNSPNVVSYNLRVNGGTPITGITYLSWAVRNLIPNTTYTFEVQAVNSSGVPSAWSTPVNATTSPIAAPGNVRASVVSSSQINIFWDGSSTPGVSSYQLRVNGGTPITGIIYLSWAVRNLIPNTAYTFEVRAVDGSGNVSAWSTPVNATTMPLPTPANFRASVVSASQINLFWDGVSTPGVASYNLRVNGSTIISNITFLSWAVTGLTPNTTYSFEVRSVDGAGNVSAWSNPINATTPGGGASDEMLSSIGLSRENLLLSNEDWRLEISPEGILTIGGYVQPTVWQIPSVTNRAGYPANSSADGR